MRVLAFDTATRATAVALCAPELAAPIEARDDPPSGSRPGHAAQLLGMVERVMCEADLGWDAIDRLAVGVGPGTFTGLRIGVATARALAAAREIPLVGISTLKSVALTAARSESSAATIVAVLDARRREVFAAAWRRGPDGLSERVLGPAALAPDALSERLGTLGQNVLAVGDGAVEFRDVLERSGAVIPVDGSGVHRVAAISHCLLARDLDPGAPGDVSPNYLRLPDAELARRRNAAP